ncbi:MAG: hypothetical protein ACYDH5_19895 [Acidimicrobiales bacterium]
MHDRGPERVGDEAGLGLALGPAGRDGVGDLLGLIAIGRDPDVPALAGVLAEPVPGLLQGFEHVPLGDALFDPTGQDGGGPLATEVDRLVGGEEGHACGFEVVLDLGAVVGAPGDALDGLADDRVEAPGRVAGLGQQVLDAAVSGDGDVEALVGVGVAAKCQIFAARFDVVVVGDDQRSGRQRRARVVELAGQGERRVLLVLGGHPAPPRQAQPDGVRARRGGSRGHGGVDDLDGAGLPAHVSCPWRRRLVASHSRSSLIARAWAARSSAPSSPVATSTSKLKVTSPAGSPGARPYLRGVRPDPALNEGLPLRPGPPGSRANPRGR